MGIHLTLILGGARSGKSAYALERAMQLGGDVLFVATASPSDDEMARRIEAHRLHRPPGWRTLEVERGVGRQIEAISPPPDVVLVDCLTLLAGRVLIDSPAPVTGEQASAALAQEIEDLLAAHERSPARWIVVSNEVGLGIVPETPLGRAYRDLLGWANQRLAERADEVLFMVAGIPLPVKLRPSE